MADNDIFSMEQLLSSTCDDRELAGQVVNVFLSDIPTQFENLDQALAANDAKTAERISHSIKGASATVGGELLRAVAYECEQFGHDARLEELRAKVGEMKRQYQALRSALLAAGFGENS